MAGLMLSYLKKLFQKEMPEEVAIDDVDSWLDGKVSVLNRQIAEFQSSLELKKILLAEKIAVLETAEIGKEHKVDDRVRNVVIGHKDNYLKEMQRFLGKLEDTDIFVVNKALDELSDKTTKSYQAAQHLFFQPVEDIFKVVFTTGGVDSFNLNIVLF